MPNVENKKILPFKVGADPEFLIFHGKRGLSAKNILTSFFKDKVGEEIKTGQAGYTIGTAGEFGWDGADSTGELRPNASNDPKILTENIGTMIKEINKELPFLDFTTLSIGSPIGGHIHLDLPQEMVGQEFMRDGYLTDDAQRIINRTTKLLATFLMPIIASEHRISSNARMATSYGKADDIRYERKQNGTRKFATAEVRGMSAEWITSPEIAYATICYMGVIWNEILKRNNDLIKEKIILKTKGHITSIQQMMLADYKPVEKGIINGIARMVRQFELYQTFKEEVEFILHPRDVMREKEKAGWNLETGWIKNKTKTITTKAEILNEKKLQEKIKSNQTLIETTVGIPYNDDLNCSIFAQAISNRIAVYNWKLKNNYFIYGLKKEVEGFAIMNQQNNKFYEIPKNNDKAKTIDISMRMAQKFQSSTGNGIRIDPKTGRTTTRKSNAIVIGIPYNIRVEQKTKALIEKIWAIEKGKIKEKTIDEFEMPIARKNTKDKEEAIERAVYRNGTSVNIDQNIAETLIEQEEIN